MIKIGTDNITGAPFRIDPNRHIAVIGGSGVGKSSLLERIFIAFVSKKGFGGAFFDPHGDSARKLPLMVPKSRRDDIIYCDPDDDCPQFNPLYFFDPELLEQAKESCITVLKSLSGSDTAWGNLTPYNVRNGLDVLTEFESLCTLVHLMHFLASEKYRKRLLRKTADPFVKLYAELDLEQDMFTAAINKVAKLMRPNILSVIGWPQSLDLLECMNSGKIFIFRLSKGALGEETAQILYSLIISMFSIAALKRESQAVRPPFLIVADEAQNATAGGRMGVLLAEARKYGISLCIAQQGLYQTPLRDDILTNAATQIVFNASGDDAETMSKNWNDENTRAFSITDLPRYRFFARTFNKSHQPIVKQVDALPAPVLRFKSDADRQRTFDGIVYQSKMRYAVPRDKIRVKVNEVLGE